MSPICMPYASALEVFDVSCMHMLLHCIPAGGGGCVLCGGLCSLRKLQDVRPHFLKPIDATWVTFE